MRSALLVSFLLGVTALPAQDDEFGVSVHTTLAEVRQNPEAYHNVKIVFTAQFASLGRISNPFFTKFTPTDFSNFYAWGDEQQIWREPSYSDVFGMLFLSKQSKQLEQLYSLRLYQRIECTAVVRNTFQDAPWIEVMSFRALGKQLDTPMLTHLHRGEKLMDQHLWQRAIAELSMVPGDNVPPHATRAVNRDLGVCLLRMGEAQAALGYLKAADEMGDGLDQEVRELMNLARTNPAEAIDRSVDTSSLADSERPMWEAFGENASAEQAVRSLGR